MIVIGPTSRDAPPSWSLWAPGSSASARLPDFDFAIKPRERRINHWIDKLELTSLKEMALVYQVQGRYSEAEPLHKRALAIRERVLGPVPDVPISLEYYEDLVRGTALGAEATEMEARAKTITRVKFEGYKRDRDLCLALAYGNPNFAKEAERRGLTKKKCKEIVGQ